MRGSRVTLSVHFICPTNMRLSVTCTRRVLLRSEDRNTVASSLAIVAGPAGFRADSRTVVGRCSDIAVGVTLGVCGDGQSHFLVRFAFSLSPLNEKCHIITICTAISVQDIIHRLSPLGAPTSVHGTFTLYQIDPDPSFFGSSASGSLYQSGSRRL